jgi:signal transduction histidine kinase
MRLALKFVLAFTLGNVLLAVVYGYLAMQREARLFEEMARTEAETLGHAMEDLLANAWRSSGHQGMMQVIERANDGQEQHVRIRWVWFDAPTGDAHSPSAPPERLTAFSIEQHAAIEGAAKDGISYLHIYWPIAVSAQRQGGLEFSHSLAALEENRRDVIRRTGLLIGGMALLTGLLATGLGVRLVGRPLRQIMEKVRRIAAGDLQHPLILQSGDELGKLADSLNAMCEQLAASQAKIHQETAARIAALEQLRHADRLKTVGRLAAGIAHELGTPLNVVSGRAGLIASGKLSGDDIGRSAAAIKQEAERMTRIIRQLLDFARASSPNKTPSNLSLITGQTADLLRALAEKHQVELCFTPPGEPAMVEMDAGQIQQVLTNLLVNAIQAMPGGGKVEISIQRQIARRPGSEDDRRQEYLAVAVRDHGAGIAEEHLQHLFEPFFTTKGVGEGTGLGLSIAYGIVQEHGGWIDVSSRPNEGSCFTIFLPGGPTP